MVVALVVMHDSYTIQFSLPPALKEKLLYMVIRRVVVKSELNGMN